MNSITELFKHKRSMVSFGHKIRVGLPELTIEVRSNDPDLCTALKIYFREFISDRTPDLIIHAIEEDVRPVELNFCIKPPDPGKQKVKEEYIDFADGRLVRKRLSQLCFAFNDKIHLVFGPCLENVNQVVNFVNNRYIDWQVGRGALLLHAAGLEKNGQGIAISGFSGMGKSTLSLHMMNHDLNFVSNDRVLIRREADHLGMYGVAKYPRINPGTILNNPKLINALPLEACQRLREMGDDELWDLEEKYDLYIDEIFGSSRFKPRSTLVGLVVLNWCRGVEPLRIQQVDPAERTDLMPAYIKSRGLFCWNHGDHVHDPSAQAYLGALKDCPVFELSGGINFHQATDSLLKLIQ